MYTGRQANPVGVLCIVAPIVLTGLGVAGFARGWSLFRERGATTAPGEPAAQQPTRRRTGTGTRSGADDPGTAAEEPDAKLRVTCGRVTDSGGSRSCGRYVVQLLSHTAIVDEALTFAGANYRVRILGPNALIAHDRTLSPSQAGSLTPFRFPNRRCSFMKETSPGVVERVTGDCPIDGAVHYAVNWIRDTARLT